MSDSEAGSNAPERAPQEAQPRAARPVFVSPRKRRSRRGWLVLGIVLPLIALLIRAEMRVARLSDEKQKLAEQNEQLREQAQAKNSSDVAELKAQLSALRRKVGLLEIEDPAKIYAVALEQTAAGKYVWRAYIPADEHGAGYVVRCALGAESKEISSKAGEEEVVLNLSRRESGDTRATLWFGIGSQMAAFTLEPGAPIELYARQIAPTETADGMQLFAGKLEFGSGSGAHAVPLTLKIERVAK